MTSRQHRSAKQFGSPPCPGTPNAECGGSRRCPKQTGRCCRRYREEQSWPRENSHDNNTSGNPSTPYRGESQSQQKPSCCSNKQDEVPRMKQQTGRRLIDTLASTSPKRGCCSQACPYNSAIRINAPPYKKCDPLKTCCSTHKQKDTEICKTCCGAAPPTNFYEYGNDERALGKKGYVDQCKKTKKSDCASCCLSGEQLGNIEPSLASYKSSRHNREEVVNINIEIPRERQPELRQNYSAATCTPTIENRNEITQTVTLQRRPTAHPHDTSGVPYTSSEESLGPPSARKLHNKNKPPPRQPVCCTKKPQKSIGVQFGALTNSYGIGSFDVTDDINDPHTGPNARTGTGAGAGPEYCPTCQADESAPCALNDDYSNFSQSDHGVEILISVTPQEPFGINSPRGSFSDPRVENAPRQYPCRQNLLKQDPLMRRDSPTKKSPCCEIESMQQPYQGPYSAQRSFAGDPLTQSSPRAQSPFCEDQQAGPRNYVESFDSPDEVELTENTFKSSDLNDPETPPEDPMKKKKEKKVTDQTTCKCSKLEKLMRSKNKSCCAGGNAAPPKTHAENLVMLGANGFSECVCFYPPSYRHFGCTGKLSGGCSCGCSDNANT